MSHLELLSALWNWLWEAVCDWVLPVGGESLKFTTKGALEGKLYYQNRAAGMSAALAQATAQGKGHRAQVQGRAGICHDNLTVAYPRGRAQVEHYILGEHSTD